MKKLIRCLLYTQLVLMAAGANAQISNTINTVTINTTNSDGCSPPPAGIYTMNLSYTDINTGLPVTYTGITVSVTSVNTTTYTINAGVANSTLTFPYNNGNDFVLTTGQIDLWSVTGSHSLLFWQYDFLVCSALPITLMNFAGSLQSNNTAKITWQTAMESMSSYFEITRSQDGGNFYKVGRVAAAGNSSTTLSYSFIDPAPLRTSYYRLKSVDLDGRCTYSKIIVIACSACSVSPPAVPCSFTINGPASLCNGTSIGNYALSNGGPNGFMTWTVSPASASIAVSACDNSQLVLTENSPALITLTASLSGCSSGGTVTKYIYAGTPYLNVWQTSNTNTCTGAVTYTVTVTPFPGTSASQYLWYQNGTYVGTGLSRNFLPTPTAYKIVFNGPCGQSVHNGSIGAPPVERTAFSVSPNPSGSTLNIAAALLPPCPPPPPPPIEQVVSPIEARAATAAAESTAATDRIDGINKIQIYDNMGTLKKEIPVNGKDKTLSINVGNLPVGYYVLRIYYNKNKVETQKIRVER